MRHRLELHFILVDLLGSNNVYFQPPTNIQMGYPCIVYKLSDVQTKFAGNAPYSHEKEYTVTVIDRDPDTVLPEKFLNLSKCSFDRHYTADNLNHYVFSLFY